MEREGEGTVAGGTLSKKKRERGRRFRKGVFRMFTICHVQWQPTPVFLPGESHGQRSLAGYSS